MAVIKKDGGYNALPIGYKRGNPIPLDTTAVWYNLAELQQYATSGATSYVGQILALVNESTGSATAYIIANEAGNLLEVGSATTTDNRTIILNDGALSLNEFGTKYNKYVEKTETTEAHYEKVDGFKAGLQPQIVVDADDSSKFHLEWFEPNPTTVEGLSSQITALDGRVGATETAIGTKKSGETPATGIYGDIDTLTTEVNKKVDAEDGKGLSANDFTDTLKTKLDGIEENAQVNVIETIKVNGVTQAVSDKAVDITIDAQAEYTIAKADTAETGYAATYKLTKDGTQVGVSINIPKDMVVESGSVKACTEDDKPVEGYKVGDKYIDLVLANTDDQHLYILVKDLVDTYKGDESTIEISSDNIISVKANVFATKKSVDDIVDGTTTIAKATSAEQVSDGTNTYTAANIKTIADTADANKTAIGDASSGLTKAVADLETNKQDSLTAENGIEITADNKVRLVDLLILDGGNANTGITTDEEPEQP